MASPLSPLTVIDTYLISSTFNDYPLLFRADFSWWVKDNYISADLLAKIAKDDELWTYSFDQACECVHAIINAGCSADNLDLMCRVLEYFGKGVRAFAEYNYLLNNEYVFRLSDQDRLISAIQNAEQIDDSDDDIRAGEDMEAALSQSLIDLMPDDE